MGLNQGDIKHAWRKVFVIHDKEVPGQNRDDLVESQFYLLAIFALLILPSFCLAIFATSDAGYPVGVMPLQDQLAFAMTGSSRVMADYH